ncbi:MAG: CBS domain-containing protein, partial [Candidatus Omnitrophota bacterium]|nr:CBS domain-containing protein [Candidatus Omnitrophota bacterium]
GKRARKSHFVTRGELKLLIKEGMKRGSADDMIMDMAYEIFDFGKTEVEDIMVPLRKIISAPSDTTVNKLAEIIAVTGYSWIPVYSEKPDNIIGVIKATDLLAEYKDKKALDVMRPCYLVKENELLEDVVRKMQKDRNNFAVVSGPSEKLTGIVTSEDIIEEIVGEIEDEYAPKKGNKLTGQGINDKIKL